MKQINIVNTIDEAKNLVAKQLIYDNTQKKNNLDNTTKSR